jgi:hypothetical protein
LADSHLQEQGLNAPPSGYDSWMQASGLLIQRADTGTGT